MENNHTQYAVLDSKIKELKTQQDEIRAIIMADMLDTGVEKTETAVGKFSVSQLKTWTYTPKVAELNEEFKARKATEESTGEATFVEKPSLRFIKNNL